MWIPRSPRAGRHHGDRTGGTQRSDRAQCSTDRKSCKPVEVMQTTLCAGRSEGPSGAPERWAGLLPTGGLGDQGGHVLRLLALDDLGRASGPARERGPLSIASRTSALGGRSTSRFGPTRPTDLARRARGTARRRGRRPCGPPSRRREPDGAGLRVAALPAEPDGDRDRRREDRHGHRGDDRRATPPALRRRVEQRARRPLRIAARTTPTPTMIQKSRNAAVAMQARPYTARRRSCRRHCLGAWRGAWRSAAPWGPVIACGPA
jgi:hypothetical protein